MTSINSRCLRTNCRNTLSCAWFVNSSRIAVMAMVVSSLSGFVRAESEASRNSVTDSPEAKRFAVYEKSQELGLWMSYFSKTRGFLQKHWLPTEAKSTLKITKVEVTIDKTGRVTEFQIAAPSIDAKQDQRIKDFLTDIKYLPLPNGADSLKLFLTLMSNGATNMIEYSETPAADNYYLAKFDHKVTSSGSFMAKLVQSPTDVDFGPYMATLQRKVRKAWFPPKGSENKRITIKFKVHKDGSVTNVSIDRPSDSVPANEAALKAINDSAPFATLPLGAQDDVDIQYTFEVNAGGGAKFTRGPLKN